MTNAAPVPAPAPASTAPSKKKKPGEDEPELSPEDQELKDKLELCVTRIAEGEPGLVSAAVQAIAEEVRSATTSMTAVPKPLKFLRSHFAGLVDSHAKLAATPAGKDMADVLSVLAITSGAEGERESLKFRLQGAQVRQISRGRCADGLCMRRARHGRDGPGPWGLPRLFVCRPSVARLRAPIAQPDPGQQPPFSLSHT